MDFSLTSLSQGPPSALRSSDRRKASVGTNRRLTPGFLFPATGPRLHLIALAAALPNPRCTHGETGFFPWGLPLLPRLTTAPRRLLSQPQGRMASQPRWSLSQEATAALGKTKRRLHDSGLITGTRGSASSMAIRLPLISK